MRIIRWIAILPGAILAAVVVAFPIHLVVMFTLGGWGDAPIIEIKDDSTLRAIELFLQAIFGPFAFVCAAAFTAPVQRVAVSIVAGFTVVIGAAGLAMWINSLNQPELSVSYGVLTLIANVAGAMGAILLVKHRTIASFTDE